MAAGCKEQPSKTATPNSEKTWEYSSSRDKMRGSTIYYASLTSKNAPLLSDASVSAAHVTLMLSRDSGSPKYQGEPTFMLSAGRFDCTGWTPEGCRVAIKADKDQVFYVTMTAEDCGTLQCLTPQFQFMDAYFNGSILSVIRSAKTLTVELPLLRFGLFQYEFQTEGLKWPFVDK